LLILISLFAKLHKKERKTIAFAKQLILENEEKSKLV